jgi:hypothetical protein
MMPDVKVIVDKDTSTALHDLARKFPREVYRGIGQAGSAMRSKLRKAMKKAGGEGVPEMAPWSSLTPIFNARRNKLGGRLAEGYAIQMYKKGKGALTVGFISPLARRSTRIILSRPLWPLRPIILSTDITSSSRKWRAPTRVF